MKAARQAPVAPARAEAARPLPAYIEADGSALTSFGADVLDLERKRYDFIGTKEQAIRDRLDLTATRHYQVVNMMIDDPRVEALEPQLVRRLKRLRDSRQRTRRERRSRL